METVCSILFYMILMAVSMLFAELAKKKNDYRILFVPIVLLALVAGCRSYDVGTDTVRVIESIEYTYRCGTFAHSKEYIYHLLCEFLMHIWNNPSFVLFVIALLTNLLVFLRIWDFKDDIRISVPIAVYFMFYYGMSMNIGRQCLAIAVIFYFTRFLAQKDYKKFIYGLVIGFFIHVSSAVAIILLLIYLLASEKINKKMWKRMKYIALGGIVPIAYMLYRYSDYFTALKVDIGLMQVVWLGLMIFSYFPILRKYDFLSLHNASQKVENITFIFAIAFLGEIIAFMGYIVPWAGRIGYVFKIYEIIYFGMLIHKKDYDNRMKVVVSLALLLLGVYTLMTYSAVVPYAFVW